LSNYINEIGSAMSIFASLRYTGISLLIVSTESDWDFSE